MWLGDVLSTDTKKASANPGSKRPHRCTLCYTVSSGNAYAVIERKALNVSLTPELHAFVSALVKSGNYANHSEVVRAGLRLLRHEEERRRLGFNSSSATPPENRA